MEILFKHKNGDKMARMLRMVRDEGRDSYSFHCIAKEIPIQKFDDKSRFDQAILSDIYRNCNHIRYTYRDIDNIYDYIIMEVNKIALRNKRNVANTILVPINCSNSLQESIFRLKSPFFTVQQVEELGPCEILVLYKGNGLYDTNHITDGIGSYYLENDNEEESFRAGYVMDSIENFATCIHFKEL